MADALDLAADPSLDEPAEPIDTRDTIEGVVNLGDEATSLAERENRRHAGQRLADQRVRRARVDVAEPANSARRRQKDPYCVGNGDES